MNQPMISDFFSNRSYSKQFLNLFEQMARTITNEYAQEIKCFIETNGYNPSFEELMQRMKALEQELTLRANWIREDYAQEKGRKSVKLTTGCKRVVKNALNDFLNQAKGIMVIKDKPAKPE